MGQQEIYEILKNKRLSGDDRYFSVLQLRKYVLDNPSDTISPAYVSKAVNRLYLWGIIERKKCKNFHAYRFKKSILENSLL